MQLGIKIEKTAIRLVVVAPAVVVAHVAVVAPVVAVEEAVATEKKLETLHMQISFGVASVQLYFLGAKKKKEVCL